MRGNPSIEARGGLKIYLESLSLSYDDFDAIMKDQANTTKVAYIARRFNISYPTALKWVVVYKNENKKGVGSDKSNSKVHKIAD